MSNGFINLYVVIDFRHLRSKVSANKMLRSRPHDVSSGRMEDPSGPGTRNASKQRDLAVSHQLGSSQALANESSRSEQLASFFSGCTNSDLIPGPPAKHLH